MPVVLELSTKRPKPVSATIDEKSYRLRDPGDILQAAFWSTLQRYGVLMMAVAKGALTAADDVELQRCGRVLCQYVLDAPGTVQKRLQPTHHAQLAQAWLDAYSASARQAITAMRSTPTKKATRS